MHVLEGRFGVAEAEFVYERVANRGKREGSKATPGLPAEFGDSLRSELYRVHGVCLPSIPGRKRAATLDLVK